MSWTKYQYERVGYNADQRECPDAAEFCKHCAKDSTTMGQLKCLGSYDRDHTDVVSGISDNSDYEDLQSQTTNWMPTWMQLKKAE